MEEKLLRQEGWTLLAQGAEARVFLAPGLVEGHEFSVVKERFTKSYRHPDLDAKLTNRRFKGEVRGMEKALKVGVDAPRIDLADKPSKRLVMEFVQGRTVKEILLDEHVSEERKECLALLIGKTVAQLHNAGLVHGDLTTSNLLVRTSQEAGGGGGDGGVERLTVIDFGLSFSTKSVEDMGVDLYVTS